MIMMSPVAVGCLMDHVGAGGRGVIRVLLLQIPFIDPRGGSILISNRSCVDMNKAYSHRDGVIGH